MTGCHITVEDPWPHGAKAESSREERSGRCDWRIAASSNLVVSMLNLVHVGAADLLGSEQYSD